MLTYQRLLREVAAGGTVSGHDFIGHHEHVDGFISIPAWLNAETLNDIRQELLLRPDSFTVLDEVLFRQRRDHFTNATPEQVRDDAENIPHADTVVLGCSFSYGTGLTDPADAWPAVMSRRLGISVTNLGIPGIGIDDIRRLSATLPLREDQHVIVLLPNTLRRRVVWRSGRTGVCYPYWRYAQHLHSDDERDQLRQFVDWYTPAMIAHDYDLGVVALRGVLHKRGVRATIMQWTLRAEDALPSTDVVPDFILDFAEDDAHPGQKSHRRLAELVARRGAAPLPPP